jgi:predicted  nucleic acid-binding Zn-ribbon protein
MAEQLTKLSGGVETIEKTISEKPPEVFPIDKIKEMERRVNDLSSDLDKSISSSRDFETDLTNHLNEIERRISPGEVPMERLERLEKGVMDISGGIDDLSKDMYAIFRIDINKIVTLGLKRKLA